MNTKCRLCGEEKEIFGAVRLERQNASGGSVLDWVRACAGCWADSREMPQREILALARLHEIMPAGLRAPFACKLEGPDRKTLSWWRVADANGCRVASVDGTEEGCARLVVQALNEYFEKRAKR